MKLIIGLGNPGREYEKTRHNTGFIILEELRKMWKFPDFIMNKKFNAEMAEKTMSFPRSLSSTPIGEREYSNNIPEDNSASGSRIKCGMTSEEKIILVRPQTFMNNSGEAVKKILDFYKLTPDDIFVIHDDLDIEKGKYKIATDSSSAGHNGVQNIIDQLGTQKFRRARVGISQDTASITACRINAHDYVLQNFSEEDLQIIKELANEIKTII